MKTTVSIFLLLTAINYAQGQTCRQGGQCVAFALQSTCAGKIISDPVCGNSLAFSWCLAFNTNPLRCDRFKPRAVCCTPPPKCSDLKGFCMSTCLFGTHDKSSGCLLVHKCCVDASLNATTTGMTDKHAIKLKYKERGVAASERAAREDLQRAKNAAPVFERVATVTGIPKHVLLAVASRESRIGNTGILDSKGWGDHGNAFGVMQVDKNSHVVDTTGGPKSFQHVLQGSRILQNLISVVKKKFPKWSPGWQLRGGIAAYNFGDDDVRSQARLDIGSTNNDYSSDVIARAMYFKKNL